MYIEEEISLYLYFGKSYISFLKNKEWYVSFKMTTTLQTVVLNTTCKYIFISHVCWAADKTISKPHKINQYYRCESECKPEDKLDIMKGTEIHSSLLPWPLCVLPLQYSHHFIVIAL